MTLRERIESDLAAETHASRMREIFAYRDAVKHPPPARFTDASRLVSPVQAEPGTPDTDGEASDGFDYLHAAESDYQGVCENQTGRFVTPEAFQTLRQRRDEMDAQTLTMADALDQTGRFDGRFNRGPADPGRLTLIGLFTGEAFPMPAVRRVAFLPSVAASNRAKMLRDVEHFILCHPETARMFTITRGVRCPLNEPGAFRQTVQAFHRRLSKIAANKRLKRLGVTFHWRATEFGEPKWEGTTLTLHIHAHCLVTAECSNAKKRARWRRKVWSLTGAHWSDDGRIANAREFVKYPVKPADLDAILRASPLFGPHALADLYEAVRGLHIVQPLGTLRDIRRARRAAARRVTAFNRPDGRTLEETGDWNAVKRPLASPKRHRADLKRRVLDLETPQHPDNLTALRHAANARLADETAETDLGNARQTPETPGETLRNAPRVANRIIARTVPGPYGSAVNEPSVVVWGFDGNVSAVLAQPLAARLAERHRPAWQAAQDALALIRACAPAPAADQSSQWSNNCPRARPPDPPPDAARAESWPLELLLSAR